MQNQVHTFRGGCNCSKLPQTLCLFEPIRHVLSSQLSSIHVHRTWTQLKGLIYQKNISLWKSVKNNFVQFNLHHKFNKQRFLAVTITNKSYFKLIFYLEVYSVNSPCHWPLFGYLLWCFVLLIKFSYSSLANECIFSCHECTACCASRRVILYDGYTLHFVLSDFHKPIIL